MESAKIGIVKFSVLIYNVMGAKKDICSIGLANVCLKCGILTVKNSLMGFAKSALSFIILIKIGTASKYSRNAKTIIPIMENVHLVMEGTKWKEAHVLRAPKRKKLVWNKIQMEDAKNVLLAITCFKENAMTIS